MEGTALDVIVTAAHEQFLLVDFKEYLGFASRCYSSGITSWQPGQLLSEPTFLDKKCLVERWAALNAPRFAAVGVLRYIFSSPLEEELYLSQSWDLFPYDWAGDRSRE